MGDEHPPIMATSRRREAVAGLPRMPQHVLISTAPAAGLLATVPHAAQSPTRTGSIQATSREGVSMARQPVNAGQHGDSAVGSAGMDTGRNSMTKHCVDHGPERKDKRK